MCRERLRRQEGLQGFAINGENLAAAMRTPEHRAVFLQLCNLSRCVICRRVSPQQKVGNTPDAFPQQKVGNTPDAFPQRKVGNTPDTLRRVNMDQPLHRLLPLHVRVEP